MAIDYSKYIYSNTSTPYLDAYNEMKKQLEEKRNTDVGVIEQNRDTDLGKSNAQYDSTARQNYINYMQAQKRAPEQLNALGIRGGATESSLIRLGTNYGTNVANNETARSNALNDIRNAYAKQISDYDSDLRSRLIEAETTAKQNQINWEREQMDKDLERFSAVIEGLYKSKSSYQALIKQLQASNDPNKDYKIMLATRAMNALSSGGSGGGGGGSSRSYSGGYGGGGDSTGSAKTYTAVANKYSEAIGPKKQTTSSGKKKAASSTKGGKSYSKSGKNTKNYAGGYRYQG